VTEEASFADDAAAAEEAALLAALPEVPRIGWAAAARSGGVFADAGAMAAAFSALADRWMAEDAGAADFSGLRTAGRVRAVIALRLGRLRPHREAVRRAVAVLALPRHAALAARAAAATVDAIWRAAGEDLADASRHTKRLTLGAVWAATLLFWLHEDAEDDAATLAFLDRRLAGVGRLGRWRASLGRFGPSC
jgi:ubiquinone biosynthesis protein COQ9